MNGLGVARHAEGRSLRVDRPFAFPVTLAASAQRQYQNEPLSLGGSSEVSPGR